jgi:branched-subunit amino acid ABC-type transport system permease component
MVQPDFEQFGITKEQFDSIYAKKEKIRNFTFGISSAVGILAGCIFGVYLSKGLYETALFILFFGAFLGSIFGGIFTIFVVALYVLFLYIFSPAYRSCRQYLSARSRAVSSSK